MSGERVVLLELESASGLTRAEIVELVEVGVFAPQGEREEDWRFPEDALVLARSQFVAAMVAIVTTFLPAFILSGFLFDIRSMPQVIQVLTRVVAARYFVTMLQSTFLAGDVWPVILRNGLGMAILCAVFLGIALLRFRKRLD